MMLPGDLSDGLVEDWQSQLSEATDKIVPYRSLRSYPK